MAYRSLCEDLFRQWSAERLEAWFPEAAIPVQFQGWFQLDYFPEPYLSFGAPGDRIAFLTLNPGAGEPFQRRGCIPVATTGSLAAYTQAAQKMASGYETGRLAVNARARRRIRKMRKLSKAYGQQDFFQFEMFPFHSTNLSNDKIAGCEAALDQYLQALTQHLLRFRTVWAISGGPTVGLESPKIHAFAKVLGLRLDQCQMTILKRNSAGEPTVYLRYEISGDRSRVISCMRGSNQLPANPPVI